MANSLLKDTVRDLQGRFILAMKNHNEAEASNMLPALKKVEREMMEYVAPEVRLLGAIFGGTNLIYSQKPENKTEARKWRRARRHVKRMQGEKSNRTFVMPKGYHELRDVHPRNLIIKSGCTVKLEGCSMVDAVMICSGGKLELDTRFITQRPHVNGIFVTETSKVKAAKDQIGDIFDLDKIRKDPANYRAMMKAVFNVNIK